ncbi:RluA family pseudouridine synthase [Myxococcota bacterium]|nr:RluA family pseudouridine synthase [Myxococcota bacterium]MBU1380639.1 RluA family pseudouridine synthase [Myxococcota bacterium]MBU1496981.1 RluA family pseudouridine synthase [Myxococcota bacterium]
MKDGFIQLSVKSDQDGLRLDQLLATVISRRLAKKMIEQGAVFLNKSRCKIAGRHVHAGAKVSFPEKLPAPPPPIDAEDFIIGETEDFIAVNKPFLWPTAPTPFGDLYCVQRAVEKSAGLKTTWIFQRLDYHTTGVLVFAKNSAALKTVEKYPTVKEYLAVVSAKGIKPQMINLPIAPDPLRKERYIVKKGGVDSVTEILTVDERETFSILKLRLHTGRTHQIRVHLSHLGYGVMGDPWYGDVHKFEGCDLMMLHSFRYVIEAPEPVVFEAKPPKLWPEIS